MKIRVIVPCFNEGEVVTKHDKLTEILMEDSLDKGYDYDLLFVDDGSKDNTIDHVQHLASINMLNIFLSPKFW